MLTPMARARPTLSPRFPSRLPPIAAPSIRAAVNQENHRPPAASVYSAPSKLLVTDSDATGISPSSNPSKRSPRKAHDKMAKRAFLDSSPGSNDVARDMAYFPASST